MFRLRCIYGPDTGQYLTAGGLTPCLDVASTFPNPIIVPNIKSAYCFCHVVVPEMIEFTRHRYTGSEITECVKNLCMMVYGEITYNKFRLIDRTIRRHYSDPMHSVRVAPDLGTPFIADHWLNFALSARGL